MLKKIMKEKIKGLNIKKTIFKIFLICEVCQPITLTGSLEILINTGRGRQEDKRIDLERLWI